MKSLAALAICASTLSAQEIPAPTPGKNHELLKQFEGTWDATAKFILEPGKPPQESKGEETGKMTCNGLWLVFSYRGKMFDRDFEGHGQMGYDEKKGKFVGCWVDSMVTNLDVSEGSVDATGKVFTMISESPGPDGQPVKMKQVSEIKDKDTKRLTFSMSGPDGKDLVLGTIEFRRRK